ncbi:MAG: DUF5050 domain-containing protein [Lachnospiraceae bacterium]
MKKNKDSLKVLCVILGIVVIIILVAFLPRNKIKKNPVGTVGNTAGNLNNSGLFCESDGRVYFANAYADGLLYSMNPDESDIKKLASSKVESINVGGKYIYYNQIGASAEAGLGSIRSVSGIYRTGLTGKNTVCLNRDVCGAMSLVDNTIFYQHYDVESNMMLYRINTDRTEEEAVSYESINPACVQNSTLYYNGVDKDHSLIAMNVETGTTNILWEHDVWNPIVQGDLVYFMDVHNDYKLCCYSLSTQEVKTLTEDRVDFYNVSNQMIYYQKSDAVQPALKRLSTDGLGNVISEEIVKEGVYHHINMTSQYVYFQQFEESVPVYKTPVSGDIHVTTFDAAATAVLQEK